MELESLAASAVVNAVGIVATIGKPSTRCFSGIALPPLVPILNRQFSIAVVGTIDSSRPAATIMQVCPINGQKATPQLHWLCVTPTRLSSTSHQKDRAASSLLPTNPCQKAACGSLGCLFLQHAFASPTSQSNRASAPNSSSNAFASFRSRVSWPSVNHS